ncbi:MAG: TlpA family protein disulfide reductase [Epsilonproteobacteria bacterium]|nr:TlpA family protein disulfide reductase [Campylobacterota bacterium]
MYKKIAIISVLVLSVVAIYFATQKPEPKEAPVKKFLEKNDPYIAFALPSLNRGVIDTKKLEGKVLFINFWATWCESCKVEMPSMQKLYDKFNKKYPNQFKMLAVSIDTQDVPLTVRMYALNLKLKFPILLDTNGTIKDKYNTTGVPETFIVDKKGKIFKTYIGAVDWNDPKVYKKIESLF